MCHLQHSIGQLWRALLNRWKLSSDFKRQWITEPKNSTKEADCCVVFFPHISGWVNLSTMQMRREIFRRDQHLTDKTCFYFGVLWRSAVEWLFGCAINLKIPVVNWFALKSIEISGSFGWPRRVVACGSCIDVLELFNWQHFVGVVGALSHSSYQVHCSVQSSSVVWAEFSVTFCRSGVFSRPSDRCVRVCVCWCRWSFWTGHGTRKASPLLLNSGF